MRLLTYGPDQLAALITLSLVSPMVAAQAPSCYGGGLATSNKCRGFINAFCSHATSTTVGIYFEFQRRDRIAIIELTPTTVQRRRQCQPMLQHRGR